jgi:hypothetical protein
MIFPEPEHAAHSIIIGFHLSSAEITDMDLQRFLTPDAAPAFILDPIAGRIKTFGIINPVAVTAKPEEIEFSAVLDVLVLDESTKDRTHRLVPRCRKSA